MSLRTACHLFGALVAIGCGGSVMHFGDSSGPDAGQAGGAGGGAAGAASGAGGSPGFPGETVGAGGRGQGGSVPTVCFPSAGRSEPLTFTNLQYDNTIRDLLGYKGSASQDFNLPLNEPLGSGFRRESANPVSVSRLSHYLAAAETLAADAVNRNLDGLAPCAGTTVEEERACAERFVSTFGLAAFRGPLSPGEVEGLMRAFDVARGMGSYATSIQSLIGTILTAPRFYMLEPPGAPGSFGPLSPYAVASRISYFITQSTPDKELLAAAANGALSTTMGIEGEVRRLLTTPAAHESVREFFLRWLALDRLDDGTAKPTIPEFAGIRGYMRTETQLFTESVFFGGFPWSGLFLSTQTFLNEPLALIYGQPGIVGPDMRPASVDPKQRSGVLTQASFLSIFSHDISSPTLRGKFIADKILCLGVPPPPPSGVDLSALSSRFTGTTRERLQQHRTNPSCASCHAIIDTLGFAFEHYDAIGRYRDKEGDDFVDAKGDFRSSEGDLQGPFDGAIDLSSKLVASNTVRSCMARQWFQFALMRYDTELDTCSIEKAASVLRGRATLADLATAIAISDSFRYVSW